MKSICVIGGSGFLGSHVADALSIAGHEVQILDKVHSKWIKSNQKMIVGDISDLQTLDEATSNMYAVYNFAGLSDLNLAMDHPIETIQENILGNANILEACRKNQVKRFFYASTVYANAREGSFYRCSKKAAEEYIEEYKERFGLDYTILRFGSLYGSRSGDSNGLYRIVKSAIQTGRLSYQGSMDSLREYIHVEDAAQACIAALDEEFLNKTIILTGQEAMKVLDLLEMIREIIAIDEPIQFSDEPQIGHYVRTPYSEKRRTGLKYIPTVHIDLGQGLLELIDEIREELK